VDDLERSVVSIEISGKTPISRSDKSKCFRYGIEEVEDPLYIGITAG